MEPGPVSDDQPARRPRQDDPRRGSSSGRPERGGDRRGPGSGGERRDGSGRGSGGGRPQRDDRASSAGGSRGSDRGADRGPRGGTDREGQRGGSMLTPNKPRLREPAIPDGVTGFELDRSVKNQLRTLSKENAVGVGQHLVMVATVSYTHLRAHETGR